jgi:trans-2,3-dihydro-3-hydroxyanthranilate isomerase
MRRSFATLDVFTDQRFTGNPLAVVLEPEGLETAAMQAIAREFGHPETVFVFPPEDPQNHRARIRIFTPARELAFAGHPTVGTAVLLGLRSGDPAGTIFQLEEGIGPVICGLEARSDGHGRARFGIPQFPTEVGAAPDNAAIAAALGISPAEIGFEGFRPSRWSAGNPFTFVPLAGLAAMARCSPDRPDFGAAFGTGGAYLFCRETVELGHAFHARMFAPAMGIREDPATGSAAAAFVGVLGLHVGEGAHTFTIEQGYEMGRPSLIHLAMTMQAGRLVSATIAGDAVVVTEGTIAA